MSKKTKTKKSREKAKKSQPLRANPSKLNAKQAHVNNAVNFMLQQYGSLEKRVQENVTQVWDNQRELKGGMDAAEFNLRAHQKVLNAFSLEFEELVSRLNEEFFKEEYKLSVIEMADVTLTPDADGEEQVVRRLNWPYYHKEVEADFEAKKAEEKRKALEFEKQLKDLTEASADLVKAAEEAGNDPEEVKKEYESLMKLSQDVSTALGNKMRGEEYDQGVLDEASAMIDKMARLGDEDFDVVPPEEADDDVPEGASVFGG